MVKSEQYGIRDLRYNKKHRAWGDEMFYTDFDGIEYDREGNTLLIKELKHGAIGDIDFNSPQCKAYRKAADKLEVPFLIVRYFLTGEDPLTHQINRYGRFDFYQVFPGNQLAEQYTNQLKHQVLSEKEYVSLIYQIRKEPLPEEVAAQLTTGKDMYYFWDIASDTFSKSA